MKRFNVKVARVIPCNGDQEYKAVCIYRLGDDGMSKEDIRFNLKDLPELISKLQEIENEHCTNKNIEEYL